MRNALLSALLAMLPAYASACWEDIGAKYGIHPYVLFAIAQTESGLNPAAYNRKNKNGSYDIGLMQINSGWLPTLRKYGITESRLLDPCTNIEVGAWILANNVSKMGYNWNAIGAYNAKTPWKRQVYAGKVSKNLQQVIRQYGARNSRPPTETVVAAVTDYQ